MTELIAFWGTALIIAIVLVALRDVYTDDPRRSSSHRPPRSHHDDPFSHTGAWFH
ncbi:hypothetical protein [Nocardioides donggukensis]|uniref:Uncharacterized protein n=1 Tax=Nocardioides donggukensis TaxID=2774019 RepID=A0A927K411_9ACTN|nr:hypothetical protein [Nocardioides donggukensis]MBD8869677.1 hypothetical protein [Nocardioides donggukensis]